MDDQIPDPVPKADEQLDGVVAAETATLKIVFLAPAQMHFSAVRI